MIQLAQRNDRKWTLETIRGITSAISTYCHRLRGRAKVNVVWCEFLSKTKTDVLLVITATPNYWQVLIHNSEMRLMIYFNCRNQIHNSWWENSALIPEAGAHTLTGKSTDNDVTGKKWKIKLTSLVVIQSSGTDAFVWNLLCRRLV